MCAVPILDSFPVVLASLINTDFKCGLIHKDQIVGAAGIALGFIIHEIAPSAVFIEIVALTVFLDRCISVESTICMCVIPVSAILLPTFSGTHLSVCIEEVIIICRVTSCLAISGSCSHCSSLGRIQVVPVSFVRYPKGCH